MILKVLEKDTIAHQKQYVLLVKRLNANAIKPHLFQDGYMDIDNLESIYTFYQRKDTDQTSFSLCSSED